MAKILIVDDEINIQLLYKEEFQGFGHQINLASTAEEAMEKIQQSKPDLIILDIKMPGTDGIEFMRKLKEEKSDISVVLCSAYGGFKNDFRVWASDAYVIKSANLTELKSIVKQTLDHKRSD